MACRSGYLCARPRLAHFPFVKTFEQFDFGFQAALDERQIRELRSLRSSSDTSITLPPPLTLPPPR
jgi:DNA replication protein DnaC